MSWRSRTWGSRPVGKLPIYSAMRTGRQNARQLIQVLGVVLATWSFASPVGAQLVPPPPELNPIPAPLPPPPQPPVINGPLTEGQQIAPRTRRQRRLETQSDRVARCLDEGASYGLRGGKLDAYSRRCANAH